MDLSAAEKPAPDNKTLLHITIISIVVFLLALFCIRLSEQSENLAPLWFPTAVLMVALFHHPMRYWSWQLLAAGICIVAANYILYGISWFPLPLTLINLTEAAAGAWLLRKFLQPKDPLNNLFSWLKFSICTVVIVPLISGLAAAWYLAPQNGSFTQVLTVWFMSEAIGMLALGPVGLLYRRGYFNITNKTKALFDMTWMMIVSLSACYLGLMYLPFPFTFIIMALIWASIRLPRFETFTICFLATLLIAMMINFNLFTLHVDTKLSVQAFSFIPLLMVLIPPHAMAMVMHAFRMEKEHIVESENRFRNAMEYSAIGMALVSPEGKWMQVNQALCKLLGYRQETLLTLTFQQITHPEDLSADLKLLDDLYHGHIPSYSMEKRYIRSDGEVVWALLVVSVVRDHEQQPLYYISQVEDINDLKKSEIVNRRLMERITLANEAGGIGIWELDIRKQLISWDKRMYELYHVPLNTPVDERVWQQYIHPEDINRVKREYSAALTQRQPYRLDFRLLLPNGDIVHLRNQANMICDKNGNILRLIGTTLDMTEIRNLTEALHEEKERLHITLDSIGEAVVCTDQEMKITFMNPVAEKMTGWANTIALGQPIQHIIKLTNGVDGPEIDNPIEHCLTHRPHSSLNESIVLHHRDGQYYDIQESVAPLKTLEGTVVGAVLVFQDVGESRAMMRKLSHSASHDNLTGLPNRANFENKLKAAIQKSIDFDQQHALAFLDLDYFKAVNDTAGHPAGDALLKELSQLMRQHLRNSDCVARLGGDEFGLLMLNCTLPHAEAITQSLVSMINGYHFYWEDKLYRIGASAGVTQISSSNSQRSEIMAQADIACYTAKHSGRGQVYLYQPRQKQLLARQHELLSREDVESILSENQLLLQVTPTAPPKTPLSVCFYQVSFEIDRPQSPLVSQSAFEEAATLYNLLPKVDSWICEQLLVDHAQAIHQKGLALAIPLSQASLASWANIHPDNHGNCPFLDEQQLCQIHKHAGANALSNSCATYPRVEHIYKNQKIKSMSLSCPEVTRKVLFSPEALILRFSTIHQYDYYKAPDIVIDERIANRACAAIIAASEEISVPGETISIEESLWAINRFLLTNQMSSDVNKNKMAEMDSLRAKLISAVASGKAADELMAIDYSPAIRHELFDYFYHFLAQTPDIRGKKVLAGYADTLQAVLTDTLISPKHIEQQLSDAWHQHALPFFMQHSSIWRNYFFYRIHHDQLAMGDKCAVTVFNLQVIDFFYLKTLISAHVMKTGQLVEDDLIDIVYSYHACCDTSDDLGQQLTQELTACAATDDFPLLSLLI